MGYDKKRYPIGPFEYGKSYSKEETLKNIKELAKLPKSLKKVIKKLSGDDLDLHYRRDGWTVRQVIHHIADSHINAYLRLKLAVTESTPTIKPYDETLWAETDDAKFAPIKLSVNLITALHKRLVAFLRALDDEDLIKEYYHPGYQRIFTVSEVIALYAWHGKHHVGHVKIVANGEGVKKIKVKKPIIFATSVIDSTAEIVDLSEPVAPAPIETAPVETKRTRRTKEQIAADKAAKAAAPKTPKTRVRRTKAQIEADRAAIARGEAPASKATIAATKSPKAKTPAKNNSPKKSVKSGTTDKRSGAKSIANSKATTAPEISAPTVEKTNVVETVATTPVTTKATKPVKAAKAPKTAAAAKTEKAPKKTKPAVAPKTTTKTTKPKNDIEPKA